MIRVYRLNIDGGSGGMVVPAASSSELAATLEDIGIEEMAIGECVRIHVEEMDQDRLDNLPEFDGF